MKFNATRTGRYLFEQLDLEGAGYDSDEEYKYSELEDDNHHAANFLFNLIARGKENIAKYLYELGLFHDTELGIFSRGSIYELESFLQVTIEYALRTDEMWNK